MILLATASQHVLERWQHGLRVDARIAAVDHLESLNSALRRWAPGVLLLDLVLPGLQAPAGLRHLRKASPVTRIVAVSGPLSDDAELALFMAGARGCCRYDIEPQLLNRVVVAVGLGELWIRRAITPRLLDELGSALREHVLPPRASAGHLAELTEREREIATLIGAGSTNKQIARQLAITERTVKAHLTGIFRKLGIGDRLKLALRVTGQLVPEREPVQRSRGETYPSDAPASSLTPS